MLHSVLWFFCLFSKTAMLLANFIMFIIIFISCLVFIFAYFFRQQPHSFFPAFPKFYMHLFIASSAKKTWLNCPPACKLQQQPNDNSHQTCNQPTDSSGFFFTYSCGLMTQNLCLVFSFFEALFFGEIWPKKRKIAHSK